MSRFSQNIFRSKGFTLIELLITISIISLLMGIMLPALARARSIAQSVVCRSNLRQIGIANIGYAIENNESFVPGGSDMWESFGGNNRWHGRREKATAAFDPTKGPLRAYLLDGQIKECPGMSNFHEGDSWNESFEKGGGGYGYNKLYLGSRMWQKGLNKVQRHQRTTKTLEVRRPSETLMFADTAFEQNGNIIEYSFAEAPFTIFDGKLMTFFSMKASIHFRHDKQANIVWCDGHVSSKTMGDSTGTIHQDSDNPEYNIGWPDPISNALFDFR